MYEFDMFDLGRMRYFLGVEVIQNSKGIFMCQRKYAREVLARFGMSDSKTVGNPIMPGTRLSKDEKGTKIDSTMFKQVVGSLMYLTATSLDIMFGVSLISRYMSSPTEEHWYAPKRILRYINGTIEMGILYKGDLNDKKSTFGFVFLLARGAVSWSSKKQPVVTLSTTEAEYIAVASCACQYIWLMRDLVNGGTVKLRHCNTENQIADIMTKPLKKEQFIKL
eukprot:XP_015582200.1 uncharacterized protein LOC107262224 [Ricinus communis]